MAKTKKQKREEEERFLERELSWRPPFERVFGIGGLTRPMGYLDYTDDSLEQAEVRLVRDLEDIERGWRNGSARAARRELAALRNEIEIRDALRECYGARDFGFKWVDEWSDWGAFVTAGEIRRTGQLALDGPSYGLARFLDLTRAIGAKLTVLEWGDEFVAELRTQWRSG